MRFGRFAQLLAAAVLLAAAACSSSPSGPTTDASGVTSLQITDVRLGTGAEAINGRTVTVHYSGFLYNTTTADHKGTLFESSRTANTPYSFVLGAGIVIRGWDMGVLGMRVGGQRTLVIPSSLAYGNRAQGSIPPNSTLVFDIEVLEVR